MRHNKTTRLTLSEVLNTLRFLHTHATVSDPVLGPQDRHRTAVKSLASLSGCRAGFLQGESKDPQKVSGNLEKGFTWSDGGFFARRFQRKNANNVTSFGSFGRGGKPNTHSSTPTMLSCHPSASLSPSLFLFVLVSVSVYYINKSCQQRGSSYFQSMKQ